LSRIGFIDLHSHVLPGIDDGCTSLDDSLACVQELIAHGFVGTVCTPHMCVTEYPEIRPASVAGYVERLQQQLREAGVDYPLWAGGELRLAEETVSWLEEHGVPTLGPGRHVLTDYWGDYWPACADRALAWLFEQGYQPILAHPERMNLNDQELDAVLARLERSGVWLQGNLKCIAGNEGPRPQQRMQRWLDEGRYRLVATDMHRPRDLAQRLAGLEAVSQQVGQDVLQRLLAIGPHEILGRE
jgi:protein-tyrosine phosphatase